MCLFTTNYYRYLNRKINQSFRTNRNKNIGIAGGVSANSGLREGISETGKLRNWNIYIPEFKYSTDNAAMIGITGYYKFLKNDFSNHSETPFARIKV